MRTSIRIIVALLLVFIVVPSSAHAEYQFVRKDNNPTLIIFVHGIVGSASGTWLNTTTNQNWPDLVKSDPLFNQTDILVYDYPSSLLNQKYSMDGLSQRMAIEFRSSDIDIEKYENIVFVAHSMGGIITRKYLLENLDIVPKVKALYLFSTPMNGSSLANVLAFAKRSSLIQKLRKPTDSNGYLSDIRTNWREKRLSKKLDSYCAFETAPVLRAVKAVQELSAELLCDSGFVEIPMDHFGMVKPESIHAYPHLVLRDWYARGFPDARKILDDQNAGKEKTVLFANCGADKLGPIVNETIEEELEFLGFEYGRTRKLPKNWKATYKSQLWTNNEPKVLLIHLSCFQDKPNSLTAYKDRNRDFIRLLRSLRDDKAKILVYSRVFSPRNDPNFIDNHIPQKLVKHYLAAGRLKTFPIKSIYKFESDSESRKRLRSLIDLMMSVDS